MSPSHRSQGRPDDSAVLRRLHALTGPQEVFRPARGREPDGTGPDDGARTSGPGDDGRDGDDPAETDLPPIGALPAPPYAVGPAGESGPLPGPVPRGVRPRPARRGTPGSPRGGGHGGIEGRPDPDGPARSGKSAGEGGDPPWSSAGAEGGAPSAPTAEGADGARSGAGAPRGGSGAHRREAAAGPPPGYVEVVETAPTLIDRAGGLLARLAPAAAEQPRLGRAGVRALLGVCAVAVLATGWFLLQSRPDPEPAPAARVGGAPPSASASEAPPPPPEPSGDVVVHVGGDVETPGIVTLPTGSRVSDAIKAAGGLRPDADLGLLNLARPLVDGEQVLVGATPSPAPGAPPPAPGAPSGAGASPGGAPGAPIDLNTATLDQLDTLPGVGPVLAQRILDFRTESGGFRSVEQLQDVSGIGEKRFAELGELVTVSGAR